MFPAHAGMILVTDDKYALVFRVPHGCGDDSRRERTIDKTVEYSTRIRGWLRFLKWNPSQTTVFPTYAGMILYGVPIGLFASRVPCVCGNSSRMLVLL